MKDIIWTLIIVWLIYKVIDVFRSNTIKRTFSSTNNQHTEQHNQTTTHSNPKPEKHVKDAVKKHLNKEGEYVDFEEVK